MPAAGTAAARSATKSRFEPAVSSVASTTWPPEATPEARLFMYTPQCSSDAMPCGVSSSRSDGAVAATAALHAHAACCRASASVWGACSPW